MTWKYKLTDAGNLSVYDHAGNHATTVMNDRPGIRTPDDVLNVMHEECAARNWDLSDAYVVETIKDAAFERIEEDQSL